MFHFAHNNLNVLDLDRSMKFYEEALGLKESAVSTARVSSSSIWATPTKASIF